MEKEKSDWAREEKMIESEGGKRKGKTKGREREQERRK